MWVAKDAGYQFKSNGESLMDSKHTVETHLMIPKLIFGLIRPENLLPTHSHQAQSEEPEQQEEESDSTWATTECGNAFISISDYTHPNKDN